MKKWIAGMGLLAAAANVQAVAPGGPNCGWGNLLFQGQSGMIPHFAASITNGTSGNATFGMTSGTNGCSTSGTLTYGGKELINAMLGEFGEDVARGEGDAMTAIAVALGIAPEDRAHFATLTHQHFTTLFPSADVSAEQVIDTLAQLMKADATLAKYAA